MKEVVVISGKGGTGKTSLTAGFATLAEGKALADCDVDASDLHLVLDPHIRHEEAFSGGKQARIRPDACTACGKCRTLCRFEAVHYDGSDEGDGEGVYRIDPIACEGCGVCAWFCPEKAIAFEEVVNGRWFISDTRHGPMVHARLGIAEENSGKLVSLVRRQARRVAEEQGLDLILVDGAPGIGCAVIASVAGADLALVVTEPTLSGVHDFQRIVELADHFGVPAAVCINKWDLNPEVAARIEREAQQRNVSVAGRVRYDSAVVQAQIMKATVTEYTGGAVSRDIQSVWRHVIYALG